MDNTEMDLQDIRLLALRYFRERRVVGALHHSHALGLAGDSIHQPAFLNMLTGHRPGLEQMVVEGLERLCLEGILEARPDGVYLTAKGAASI